MSHLCECGCGKETNIVTRSDTARGITKGGNPSNNVPSNLVICENQAYHRFLHARMRAVKLGYPAVYKWCHCCSKYDSANNMAGKGERRYHQACMAKYDRERRKGAKDKKLSASGTVTQLAEQRLDNPFDEGSIPPSPVNFPKGEQTSREELP